MLKNNEYIHNESIYNHDLDKNHRFPMIKYKLLPEILVNEGTLMQ